MNILIVSNGYGEDFIACNLIQAIQHLAPEAHITVLPLVGEGLIYQQKGFTPTLKNPIFPSGGFIRTPKDLLLDLQKGLLQNHIKQYKHIKQLSPVPDLTICVGDLFCLWMTRSLKHHPLYFLPTAKSDLFMKHSWIEKRIIKSLAKHVFPRDNLTTDALKKASIPTSFFGNPMMDNLVPTAPTSALPGHIALLPGSREEAYDNLIHMLRVIECDLKPELTFTIAKAPSLNLEILAKKLPKTGWKIHTRHNQPFLQKGAHVIPLETNFATTIQHAHIVCGLSGTANEQAFYMGKTVICFEGFGPQSTKKRFLEQQKLLGKNLIFLDKNNPEHIFKSLQQFVNRTPLTPHKKIPAEYKSGASEKIITFILNQK